MPVGKTSAPPRQLIMLIVATIVGVASMVFLVTRTTDLAQDGQVQLNIGDEVFAPGKTDRLSDDIAAQGPLLLADQAGRDRDIYLQHIGDDPDTGWFAFAVRPPDAGRECFAKWQPDQDIFTFERLVEGSLQETEPCDDRTFPADGEGLRSYPVQIDAEDRISIDLNAEARTTTTVEADATDE